MTTTVTQTVGLRAHVKQMLLARLEEHAQLRREITEKEARLKRIGAEVEALFAAEGEAAALVEGTDIDGFKVKRVGGTTRTLDRDALMRALDLDADQLDAFYDEKPKKPYVRVTAPGKSEE